MGEYKTPGVYIKEKNAFGNSVVVAETAIPVFIGLTEKTQNGTESLQNKPVRISSMLEYAVTLRRKQPFCHSGCASKRECGRLPHQGGEQFPGLWSRLLSVAENNGFVGQRH